CGLCGRLGAGFGTHRDYVMGLRLVHIDGTESKSGGRVVKNVAGYDMNKLYVGSFGTLAVLTEVILKLRPLPERSATMVIFSSRLPHLFTLTHQLLRSGLQPVSASLVNDRLSRAMGETGNALFIRFMESDTLVKFQSEKAARIVAEALGESGSSWLVEEEQEGSIWRTIADMDRFAANAFKLSVPVSRIPVAFELCLSHSPGCVAAA